MPWQARTDRQAEEENHPRDSGQDLSLLIVEELTERIALLNAEHRAAAGGDDEKARAPDAANSFFKDVKLRVPGAMQRHKRVYARLRRAMRASQNRTHSRQYKLGPGSAARHFAPHLRPGTGPPPANCRHGKRKLN